MTDVTNAANFHDDAPFAAWISKVRWLQVTILLAIIASCLLLNQSFILLRLNVHGLPIPIGEGFLAICLCLVPYVALFRAVRPVIRIEPMLLWWALGLSYAAVAFFTEGGSAIRGATHVVDSLFLIIGVQVGLMKGGTERVMYWMRWILLLTCIYMFTYPFRFALLPMMPTVIDTFGGPRPMVFLFVSTSVVALFAAACLILFEQANKKPSRRAACLAVAIILTTFAIILFQARLTIIQAALIWCLFLIFRRRLLWRWTLTLLGAFMLIVVLGLFHARINARLTPTVDLGYYLNSTLSIAGIPPLKLSQEHYTSSEKGQLSGYRAAESKYSGWSWRMNLWSEAFLKWKQNARTVLFGIGLRHPLVSVPANRANGQPYMLHDPHDSYLDMLGKFGIAGLLFWVGMCVVLLKAWFKTYCQSRETGNDVDMRRLLALLLFTGMLVVQGLVEGPFNKPFFMIPLYTFWGVFIGEVARRNQQSRASEPPPMAQVALRS